jgi:hypothetical protein
MRKETKGRNNKGEDEQGMRKKNYELGGMTLMSSERKRRT